jgi:hypothetical protein
MASHTLEKAQLDAGVGPPGQRRVSQPLPHKARQPKIINQLVPSRRIARCRNIYIEMAVHCASSAYSPISALNDGSSRIGSKSESLRASARSFSDAPTARRR